MCVGQKADPGEDATLPKPGREQLQNRPENTRAKGRDFPLSCPRRQENRGRKGGLGATRRDIVTQRETLEHRAARSRPGGRRPGGRGRRLAAPRFHSASVRQREADGQTDLPRSVSFGHSAFKKGVGNPVYTSVGYDSGSRAVDTKDFAEVLGTILRGRHMADPGRVL